MSKENNRFFEFDNFRADPFHKCLWFGAELVSLTPKSFDTLLVLIKNKGQVVDKDTLMDEVWGDTFVEEAALKQNISTLRRKLESLQTGKQFIETIPRRGYRFVGDVREIFDEEEIYVVETRTRTHIIANHEIHNSEELPQTTSKENTSVLTLPQTVSITKNKFLLATSALVLIIIAFTGYFTVRYLLSPQTMAEEKFSQFEMIKLTANGNIHKIAISPDGKYIALVEKKDDLQMLFIRQTNSTNNVEIISPTKDDIFGITFAPDSESIFYSFYPEQSSNNTPRIGILSRIPILGGTRTEVLRDIDSPTSFSPDGKKYLFIRDNFKKLQSEIIIYDSTATNDKERIIATRSIYDRFNKDSVVWSSDGKKIAAVAYNSQDNSKPFQVLIIDSENGHSEVLANHNWSWVGQISWLKDGSGIVLTGFDDSPNLTDEVWIISYPNGNTRKITNGINGFFGMGITADSNSMIAVKSDRVAGLWAGSKNFQDAKIIQKNISNGSRAKFGLNFTADGKIVYSNSQLGNADIWMMNLDGSAEKQLTNDVKADLFPTVSQDNRYIVFVSTRSGTKNIWRMNFDGTNQVQLTNFEAVFSPSLTPDGEWIYFSASTGKVSKPTLWKIPITGGQPESVGNVLIFSPQVSPNGKFLACFYPHNGLPANQNAPLKLTILSLTDASIIRQFDIFSNGSQISWTPDSNSISYIAQIDGVSSVLVQEITGGMPQKVHTSPNEEIFSHHWSIDGENLIMEKGSIINDIVLIKSLNPN